MGKYIRDNLFLLVSLAIITPLGFYTKYYKGVYQSTINDRICDLLYVTFWILVFKLILPKVKDYKIVLWVFVTTSVLEFLQLWHPPFLQLLRSTFWGRTLLGTNYIAEDFLYYVMGTALGYLLILKSKNNNF